jgi:hypothetical protein
MPSVTLTDAASARLETISFFLVLFLVSVAVIRWIWTAMIRSGSRGLRVCVRQSTSMSRVSRTMAPIPLD